MPTRRSLAAALTLALVAPVAAMTTTQAAPSALGSRTGLSAADRVNPKPWPAPEPGAKGARPDFAQDRVLVKFTKGSSKADRDRALKSRGARAGGTIEGTSFVTVTTGKGKAATVARQLRQDRAVATVSLDYIRKATATPNDPAYYYADQNYLKTVRMPEAWDRSKGSTSNIVAILDTGINAQHEDLIGKVTTGFNAITNTSISSTSRSDDNGHGTFVASIVAAGTNNGKGMAGVAWTAKVMPVKVLNSNGLGSDSDIAQGVTWAASRGAKVINMSLGGSAENPVLGEAIDYARSKGALVIAAAGNDGDDTPQYPAAYEKSNVIAVGATDWNGKLTDFSTHGSWVDVAAPGFDIIGAGLAANDYWIGSGTSFSAPVVAGVAGLIRTKYPTYTAEQIKYRLTSTARDAGPRGIDPFYGWGYLDAAAALGAARGSDFGLPALGTGEPNDVPARATSFSGSASGSLAIEGDVDWFAYTNTVERNVDLTLTPPAFNPAIAQSVDAELSVYDANHKLIGHADSGGIDVNEVLGFRMGVGKYYFAVSNWNGSRTTTAYSLTLANASPAGRLLDRPVLAPMPVSQYTTTAIGDVTGDGRDDVISTLRHDEFPLSVDLLVHAQRADGSLDGGTVYQTAGRATPGMLAVGDVDGNGKDDLVVGTSAGPQVLLQNASGTLSTATLIPGHADRSTIAVADFDGDNDVEIVASNNNATVLLTRQGDGTYTSETITNVPYLSAPTIADVDGDGRLDAVFTSSVAVTYLRNTTEGWVYNTMAHDTGGASMNGVAVTDLNGDGRKDIVATITASGSKLGVWTQAADGTFPAPTYVPLQSGAGPLRVGDLTEDGKDDVVVAHNTAPGRISVLPQGASGLGSALVTTADSPAGFSPGALSLGDVDGDTRLDAVVPISEDSTHASGIGVLRNATAPTTGTTRLWVRSTAPADVSSGLPVTTKPTVTFVRSLDAASVTTSTVRLTSGRSGGVVAGTVAYDPATRVATITPAQTLTDNTPFRITVNGVKDTNGETIDEAYSTTFSTVDTAPGAVTSVSSRGNYLSATLSWQLPRITDLSSVVIRRSSSSTAPSSPTSGTAVYSGTGTSVTVKGLTSGVTYTYGIWVKDKSGKYSSRYAVRHRGTASTISSNRTSVVKGSSVTLSGKLVRKDTGAAIPGATVELWQRRVGSTTWSKVLTRVTTTTGLLSSKQYPASSRDYRWIYRGSSAYMGNTSSNRRISVS